MGLAILQDWQVAQTQLDRALDAFLDACSALHLARYSAGSELHSFAYDQLDLVAIMEQKMARSAALLRQVRNASCTVAPINRLPSEILTKTFAFCIPPLGFCSTMEDPHPLFMITQVCAQWRRVATTTPSLWSQITIDFEADEDSVPKYISMLKQTRIWLDRASDAPLSVRIQTWHRDVEDKQITDILLPYLPRITRLSFRRVTTSLFSTLFRLLLEETSVESVIPTETVFGALSALDMQSLSDVQPLQFGQDKWASIRHLKELKLSNLYYPKDNLHPRDLATMLVNFPNLQVLRLHHINARPTDLGEHPDINLPALRRLEIGLETNDNGLRAVLPILRPGQLELDVVLHVPGGDSDDTISSLQVLLRGSYVVTLEIQARHGYPDKLLAEYLDCVPDIHTLTLRPTMPSSFFIEAQLPRRLSKILLCIRFLPSREYESVVACLEERGIKVMYKR